VILNQYLAAYWKWYETGTQLLWNANRKANVSVCNGDIAITLNDHLFVVCFTENTSRDNIWNTGHIKLITVIESHDCAANSTVLFDWKERSRRLQPFRPYFVEEKYWMEKRISHKQWGPLHGAYPLCGAYSQWGSNLSYHMTHVSSMLADLSYASIFNWLGHYTSSPGNRRSLPLCLTRCFFPSSGWDHCQYMLCLPNPWRDDRGLVAIPVLTMLNIYFYNTITTKPGSQLINMW